MCGGIGSWVGTIREVSRREQAGCHGVREPGLTPVRMLFGGKYTKAFTERAREPQNGGIDTGLFCPIRLHTRICASYGEASHSTKVFSTSGKIPGRIPWKRGSLARSFQDSFWTGIFLGEFQGKCLDFTVPL